MTGGRQVWMHSPAANEWRETEVIDERFLPTIENEASEIVEGLFLGSEQNASDVVWLKVQGISRILTINSYRLDPVASPHLSESLKAWYAENVEQIYIQALDTPTQLVLEHLKPAIEFISSALDEQRRVLVHCGRGISRSATLVIAALMHRDKLAYSQAFALVSSRRHSIYPNVGFQIQLCLFERESYAAVSIPNFDVAAEIAISIERTLDNIEEQMEAMFESDTPRDDPGRWMDFGFFFQNCREYLGHVDIGLPGDILNKAEDIARRLKNLEMVFQGAGVATAARVGNVIGDWQTLQQRMLTSPGAILRVDLSSYVSVLKPSNEDAGRRPDGKGGRDEDGEPEDKPNAKRRRES